MTLQLLKMRTLTFERPADTSYLEDDGKMVVATTNTTFTAKGSLQPLSNKDKQALQTENGVRVKAAFYFYTKTGDIRTIDVNAAEPDRTTINGVTYEVWANSPWDGPYRTDHYVITLIQKDRVDNNV